MVHNISPHTSITPSSFMLCRYACVGDARKEVGRVVFQYRASPAGSHTWCSNVREWE